ncbi:MAG TPA: PIN domain-containing protein [Kiritimatiellia bacterium]|nr:PIN domain-containing protein [Kiritimatiellia bacterium]
MIHLLDTSAILTHLLDEPGSDDVADLLAQGPERVLLAAPTWVELDRRLRELIAENDERERVFNIYTKDLSRMAILDMKAIKAALLIQSKISQRIPMVDALIAGCASAHNATLVHRDPHFDTIPASQLKTLRLPDKIRDR